MDEGGPENSLQINKSGERTCFKWTKEGQRTRGKFIREDQCTRWKWAKKDQRTRCKWSREDLRTREHIANGRGWGRMCFKWTKEDQRNVLNGPRKNRDHVSNGQKKNREHVLDLTTERRLTLCLKRRWKRTHQFWGMLRYKNTRTQEICQKIKEVLITTAINNIKKKLKDIQ